MFFDMPQPPAHIAFGHNDVCINCTVSRQMLKATDGCGAVKWVIVYQSKFNGKAWTQPGFGYGSPRTVTLKFNSPKGYTLDLFLQPLN